MRDLQIAHIALLDALQTSTETDISLEAINSTGSSGNKVYMFRVGSQLYAVKCGTFPRISTAQQYNNWQYLSKHLSPHLPHVLLATEIDGRQMLVAEAPSIRTLHDAIAGNEISQDHLIAVWTDISQKIQSIWTLTVSHPWMPEKEARPYEARLRRIMAELSNLSLSGRNFITMWDYPFLINGQKVGRPSSLFRLFDSIQPPNFSVGCHGDPQPNNVLFDGRQWFLVDWEWSGDYHDWRLMASQMYGWWPIRYSKTLCEPVLRIEGSTVIMNYDLSLDDGYRRCQAIARDSVAGLINYEALVADNRNINLFLSLMYLGFCRFIGNWNQEWMTIPLIGEALRILQAIDNDNFEMDGDFGLDMNRLRPSCF